MYGMVLKSRSNILTRPREDIWEGGETGDDEDGDDSPDDYTPLGNENLTPEQIVNSKKYAIVCAMGSDLRSVKEGLSVIIGIPNGSPFASCEFTIGDLWEKLRDYTIVIIDGLNDTQQSLILAHELMHLALLQISQDAGSQRELGVSNPELLGAMNLHGVNEGHHFIWDSM